MNRYGVIGIIAVLVGVVSIARAADDRQVTTSGTYTITAPPEILRVTVLLKVEGKDVKDALAKLGDEKKSAQEKLARLNVPANAIKFTEATMGDKPLTPQQRQMQMYMQARNGGAGAKKPTTGPTPVTLTGTMSADIALKIAHDKEIDEEMLIAVADLQNNLRDAFKPVVQRAKTPEEQEVLEEMQGADQAANGGAETKPGEPAFAYVHVVTEAEQNTAMANAFAQAKRSGERLAKAAGMELGELKSLSAVTNTGGSDENDMQGIVTYGAMVRGGSAPPAGEPAATLEAIGSQPGPVSSRITVNAGFGLKP